MQLLLERLKSLFLVCGVYRKVAVIVPFRLIRQEGGYPGEERDEVAIEVVEAKEGSKVRKHGCGGHSLDVVASSIGDGQTGRADDVTKVVDQWVEEKEVL